MLSITEMLEKIPTAKMDDQQETISIPIQEYENFRNMVQLQDKQSIIRDLQHLLLNKDEDLKRYREKYELTESVLQRTQKALDKCIQSEQNILSLPARPAATRHSRGIIQLKRSDSRTRTSLAANSPPATVELVSRAIGEDSNTSSMPDQASRSTLIEDSSLRSLPLSLSIGSPGMSTALLKKLVQENLRLKAQLEKRNIPKTSKTSEDREQTIKHLELRVMGQQQLLDDLANKTGGDGQDLVAARLSLLYKENEEYKTTREMDKIVINSLKQENGKVKREKEEIESVLSQYRQFKSMAEATDEKLIELEKKLKSETENRKMAESMIDSLKKEMDKLKQLLEKTEQDRDVAVQNYNTLCSQYHKPSERRSLSSQPAYKVQAPQLSASQMVQQSSAVNQPASLPAQQLYTNPTSFGSRQHVSPRGGSVIQPQPLTGPPISTRRPHYTAVQPQQESVAHRMSQSVYTPSTSHHSSQHAPLPTERKTYKCPRCDMVFNILQEYRNHITICLKG